MKKRGKAIDEKEKRCTQCKLKISTKSFYKQSQKGVNNQTWYYYDSMCIKCRLDYSYKRIRANKREAVVYMGEKCADCGILDINRPEIYDFHHLSPKNKEFSISKTTKSLAKIKKELDKCILLCSNCHRTRHATDFLKYK